VAREPGSNRALLIGIGVLALIGGAIALGWSGGSRPADEPAEIRDERPRDSAPSEAGSEPARPTPPAAARPAPPPRRAANAQPAPPDVAAPPADAERTASGLASKVLRPGNGDRRPGPRDGVRVHYTGWRAEDGEMFDTSVGGPPATFPVNRVIAGWTEGLQLMVEGEKRRFWIPANLAYEGNPRGPQGMLVFDVELLEVLAVPPAPRDVSAPPRNAQRSESGLAWVVLEPGEGTRRPTATDSVEVHYTGWRAEDGEMFDSSISRGEPARFGVSHVIPGWTEALQQMVEGEKRRIWIPGNLAYDGRLNRPQGMLVFDVELLRIL
jgi:peptidylprolyl isomerase